LKTLRIGSDRATDVDLACIDAGRQFVLWRQGGDVRLVLDDRHVDAARRALAFRGVRATPSDGGVPEPPPLLAAIGIALTPARLHAADEVDLLEVRVVPLSEATARLTRRPLRLWPLGRRKRARCRALLRGTDALLEVRRSAWCGRSTLGAARRSLRPVLFDRSATPRALRVYAADGALTRWING
jgi:hypothetical protein